MKELSDQQKLLAETLGIEQSQIVTNTGSTLPSWVAVQTVKAQERIREVMEMGENEHWFVPEHVIDKIFREYTIIGHWRKSYRKLGHCAYNSQEIQLNLANPMMNEEQGYKTLLHEYVHAIQYEYFKKSGHNAQFWFYCHLFSCQMGRREFNR